MAEIFFVLLSMICIFIAWKLINADDTAHQTILPFTLLTPFEIAALRDGRKGVIHTVLFNLWHHQLLEVSGIGHNAKVSINRKVLDQQPANKFEETILNFAKINRKPADFFTDTPLRRRIDKHIKPINQKLEKLHLKHTASQMKMAWLVLGITLLIFISMAYTFCLFSLFCFYLLAIMIIVAIIVLKPKRITRRGNRYSKKLAEHFDWTKSEVNSGVERSGNHPNIDPALPIALFGINCLSVFDHCIPFENAFAETAAPGTDSGGCGGGSSGSDGGGDGGGGGCGGCGGGGCGG